MADERRGVWGGVVVAAMLMVATLPGRTQGLGLFTEPMLRDLALDRITFANFNLWATLVGALLCFPTGYFLDRFDRRWVTAAIVLFLSFAVFGLSAAKGALALFVWILATRGFGQSALSVASITWITKGAGARSKMAMAWYTVLLSLLFAVGFGVVGYAVREFGWRKAALAIGIVLAVVIAPMPLLRRIGRGDDHPETGRAEIVGMALGAAMKTTVFWLFVAGICAFAFVSSGLGLFNESVLAERGFDRKAFEMFLVSTTLAALVGQLLCGWLGRWHQSKFLLAEALALYGIGLGSLPLLTHPWQLWLTAAGVGISAGMMTVLFFSVWGETFGQAQLGRIQGVAQMCTVLASAAGPVVFANTQQATGSYQRVLWVTAAVVGSLAVLSCVIVAPKRSG